MEMVICTRFINLSSFTTLSAFTEEKRGGLDRWELLSHWVARVGDTGSRRLKQTFFTNAPRGHPSAARPRSHVSVICDAAEGAEKKRSQRREGGEERYKLFESRVEAERPGEGERDPRRPAAMAEEEDILSFYGEGERKTREE